MDAFNGQPGRAVPVRLRPYQEDAVREIRARVGAGVRRLIVVAPTGSGKTTIAAHIIAKAVERGSRVLFMAHRRELITQAYNRLIQLGVPENQLGVLMGRDRRWRPGAPVQVASVDTLRNRAKPLADIVFVDECHRATAKSYRDIAAYYPDALHLGLTATPFRANGAGLGDAYDDLLLVASPRRLIDEGHLVEPRVFTVPTEALPDLSAVRVKRGDYDQRALAEAVDSKTLVGNLVDHWTRHANGVRTVAFAVSVAHSEHIAEQFRQAGVAAEHLDGATPTEERDAILGRLESGETRVVSNCGVLCLDADTEILTTDGWTSIDEMTSEHLVAGWRDGEITFEKPTAVHRRARMPGERMVRLQSPLANIRVTEGHGVVHRTSPGEPWIKRPARDCVGKAMLLPASGHAPHLAEPYCDPYLENLREVELWAQSVAAEPQCVTMFDGCRLSLDRWQAVAACRGFRSWLCATRRPGRWGLVLDSLGDVPVPKDGFEFEEDHRDERVWCVTIPSGNIITRRCGAVVVLGNCEGWDQPAVKCAILARPTRSTGLYLQQAGRILRPWNGQQAIILDHGGCVLEHGLPQDDRNFSLEGSKKKRNGKAGAPVRTCPSCFAVLPLCTRICPECDTVLIEQAEVPQEREGTLVEVRSDDLKRIELERLRSIADERGYKTGWVYYRFKERFGEAPPRERRRRTKPAVDSRALREVLRNAARSGGGLDWSSIAAAVGGRAETT
jgi:superfamily II DNA or RNA helicase